MDNIRKYMAELLGTFVLVFGGTTAITAAVRAGQTTSFNVMIALAFGLSLLAGLYWMAEVSGGHFNPAVSLAMLLDKRLKPADMIGYWIFQVIGAVLASLALWVFTSRAAVKGTGTYPSLSDGKAWFIEFLFTAIFVGVILQASTSKGYAKSALISIPLTLVAVHLAIIPYTGSSVNPARTLGPDIVGGKWTGIWIYLTAPLAGAILAWLIHSLVIKGEAPGFEENSPA
jgi:aquaporin Z